MSAWLLAIALDLLPSALVACSGHSAPLLYRRGRLRGRIHAVRWGWGELRRVVWRYMRSFQVVSVLRL